MGDSNEMKAFRSYLTGERGLAAATVATYCHHAGQYVRFLHTAGAAIRASSQTAGDFLAEMRGRVLQPVTVFAAVMALKAYGRFLRDKGLGSGDLAADIKPPRLVGRAPAPLSVDEVNRLLAAPSSGTFSGLRDRAIMELLYCGLRIGEALGLDLAHLHLDEGFVKVFGKGSKERLVPIGSKATEALRHYIGARQQIGQETTALFLSSSGGRLSKNGFWRRFKQHASRSGIARSIHPHLLRHSFSVHMLAGNCDLRTLQLLLGHQSLATTQSYLRLDYRSLQETFHRSHPRS